jgi:pyrimidine operon attenuation protein / uracil phosphoribosyltransferase
MSLPNPAELISQMAIRLKAHLQHRAISEPRFIGIRTGGVWVAQALLQALGSDAPLGTLDVSFYRDDFSQNGLHPQVRPSALPFEIEGQHLVLIDDVLMSGRTIRAAMNELFDYGRPASITLVCLLDLDAGELPISPDVVGATLSLSSPAAGKIVRSHAARTRTARPRPLNRLVKSPRDDASRCQAPAAAQCSGPAATLSVPRRFAPRAAHRNPRHRRLVP